jgi:hypothetical protein
VVRSSASGSPGGRRASCFIGQDRAQDGGCRKGF